MNTLENNMWWLIGFLVVTSLCVVAMLWRNHAAKSDKIIHTKMDNIDSSVSIKPRKDTQKLR